MSYLHKSRSPRASAVGDVTHWVKCTEIGLNEDLYNEGRASTINEARAIAIVDLSQHLNMIDEAGNVKQKESD